MSFMGQKSEEGADESSGELESSQTPVEVEEKEEAETDRSVHSPEETSVEEDKEAVKFEEDNKHSEAVETTNTAISDPGKAESESKPVSTEPSESIFQSVESSDSPDSEEQKKSSEVILSEDSNSKEAILDAAEVDQVEDADPVPAESSDAVEIHETKDEQKIQTEEILEKGSPVKFEESSDSQADADGPNEPVLSSSHSIDVEETNSAAEVSLPSVLPSYEAQGTVSESIFHENDVNAKRVEVDQQSNDSETEAKGVQRSSSATTMSDSADSMYELEKLKMEMKMMESALQGAARQAQVRHIFHCFLWEACTLAHVRLT